jgi:MFS family permease
VNQVKGSNIVGSGKWMALAAALLGWMFDGFEMGLFPLVARPALRDLLGSSDDTLIKLWLAVATAGFLVGAATGGVLFGWLGDRLGRVRALMLSILTYAIFSGLCAFAQTGEQIALLRFFSALGMGGEWSLGVALVMEIWPDRSRGFLAGLIGAAANFGYLLIAVLGLGLTQILGGVETWLGQIGLQESLVQSLVANSGWRLLMLCGVGPALLTFFIQWFVPESARWKEEQARGTTSHWAARDLAGVLVGCIGAGFMIFLWAKEFPPEVRLPASAVAFVVVTLGYTYPVFRYLRRSSLPLNDDQIGNLAEEFWWFPIRRMWLGACLSGVALLGTWAAVQFAPSWADVLTDGKVPEAKAYTQITSSLGAIIGTIIAAWVGKWIGRRLVYSVLCASSFASVLLLYQGNTSYNSGFLFCSFLAGMCTASFYGWLPLYLPELFRTRFRATGQGFAFNFGRILAAIGTLQAGAIKGYPLACSVMSLVYLVGLVIIWFAPETRGQPLPE